MEFKAEDKASPSDTDKAVDGGGGMGPEEALRAFAESVGMSVDAMWEGVTREVVAEVPGVPHYEGGEIVEIDWSNKALNGHLVSHAVQYMPWLRKLNLAGNRNLKGEARVRCDGVVGRKCPWSTV